MAGGSRPMVGRRASAKSGRASRGTGGSTISRASLRAVSLTAISPSVSLACMYTRSSAVLRGSERGDEPLVGEKKRVEEGRMDPGEQGWVVGRVARPFGEDALPRPQLAVDAVVDAVDGPGGPLHLVGCAKREGEHCPQRPVQPLEPAPSLGEKAAVLGHALSDQWMGELEQDRPSPAGKEHHLAVKLPRHAVRSSGLRRRVEAWHLHRLAIIPCWRRSDPPGARAWTRRSDGTPGSSGCRAKRFWFASAARRTRPRGSREGRLSGAPAPVGERLVRRDRRSSTGGGAVRVSARGLPEGGEHVSGETFDLLLTLGPVRHHELERDVLDPDLLEGPKRGDDLLGTADQPIRLLGNRLRPELDGQAAGEGDVVRIAPRLDRPPAHMVEAGLQVRRRDPHEVREPCVPVPRRPALRAQTFAAHPDGQPWTVEGLRREPDIMEAVVASLEARPLFPPEAREDLELLVGHRPALAKGCAQGLE